MMLAFLGILIGLIPGLHVNLIAPLIKNVENFSFIVVSIALMANFFEFLRSSLFYSPGEGDVLTVHPMRRLTEEGRFLYGIKLLALGGLGGVLLSVVFHPLLLSLIPFVYYEVKPLIPFLLLLISVHLILKDKVLWALTYFSLSGLLGLCALNSNMREPLLPLLTGMFGISSLLSVKKPFKRQMKMVSFILDKVDVMKGLFLGFFSSFALSVIPSIGPSQASMIGAEFERKRKDEVFLISIGCINTSDVLLSLFSLEAIGKARLGAFSYIREVNLPLLLLVSLLTAFFSYFFLIKLSYFLSKRLEKMNLSLLKSSLLSLISFLCFYLDGFKGVLVLFFSTLLGLLAERKSVMKSHGMGCLIIPTLLYYL